MNSALKIIYVLPVGRDNRHPPAPTTPTSGVLGKTYV